MQEGGLSAADVLSGSGRTIAGNLQTVISLGRGASGSSAPQIISLPSTGGAPGTSTQGISLPSRGGMAASAFQSASNTPLGGVMTSAFEGSLNTPRQRFYVELKEGEANVVSWKKLLKDALKNAPPIGPEAPAGANPALEARIAPDRVAGPLHTNSALVEEPLPPQPNRFSSVIEKIERLYQGGGSDEEEGDVSPDDSQYDTEDDFIDDSELNEYFSVEKTKTKHTGFFVNRGKLEKINEAPTPAPAHVPRKRKRREMKTVAAEKVVEESAKKRINTGIRLKDAARKSLVSHAVDGAPSSSTAQHRDSEQPKLKKRLKPIQDGRDMSAELHPASVLESVREVLKVAKVEDKRREEGPKPPVSIVELSDDENDEEEVSKQAAGTEREVAYIPKKHIPRPQEIPPAVKASSDERQTEDSSRETKTPVITPKASSPNHKEASPGKRAGWPKGTVLERAINDLEKGVAETFPFSGNKVEKMRAIEMAELHGGKSKRMPREVKQKLAKVARLAARHGKIPEELIDRLMTILGHVMRLRTLKRNLKAMVELGMTAKLEKDVRLLSMKREVTELVKSRVSNQAVDADQRDGSSDDFQSTPGTSERGAVGGRYKWDQTTEDRICDLYDQYVEGMDEHKGPQIRKLYLELADLWPEGWMDNHGIKNAVFRAKERQRKQNKLKMGEEKRRRKEAGLSEKKNGDTSVEKFSTSSSQAYVVAPPVRAFPPSKEKLTIKSSSKQRVSDSSRRVDEDITEEHISRQVEEIRRSLGEGKRRASEQGLDDRASRRTDDSGGNRDNGSHSGLSREKQKVRLEDGLKVRRGDDVLSVKRKLPRKSYEGKIIDQTAKKRPKKESSDSFGGDNGRSSSHNLLNSPLIRLKKKKLKPADGKPYPSLRLTPPPTSKTERYQNTNPSSSSRPLYTDRIPSREERLRELRDRARETPDRAKDVARWSSEASRLQKD
ncbi:hypothetical protein R1sor_010097 [Riccia sorocarpa]|uniref:Hpc2-related domain-containing protein n=1 Tax=Riccia sorocarpa TaxID=122646 RepID=A0ABD3HYM4_9MARC